MSLKARIERLEMAANEQQKEIEIELEDGSVVCIVRTQLRQILRDINGADTGPGPAASRRDRKLNL